MIDIRDYGRILWRWRLLIVAVTVTCVVTSALISLQLPKVYAVTSVGLVSPKQLIPPTSGASNNNPNTVPSMDQLVDTYVGLINTDPVRQRLVKDGIPRSAGALQGEILASRQPNATLINIVTQDPDPAVAQSIASDIIPAFNDSLTELQAKVGQEGSKLDSLVAWEVPANRPSTPISPNIPRNILIALALGLAVSIAGALGLERLDNTIKGESDVLLRLGLPVLGTVIMRQPPGSRQAEPVELISATHIHDLLAEQYRGIRTNLLFSQVDRVRKTIVVTSTSPGEGKTTTACNLALVFAQAGTSVILVDADLRRPGVHKVFGKPLRIGLGNLILRDIPDADVILPTEIDHLGLVCAGPIPPNPSELLGSTSMQRVLDRLSQLADVVILDTAPIGAVTDATVLSAVCDGVVLVVERSGVAVPAIQRAVNTLKSVEADILGVVLNKARQGDSYDYYYTYGADPDGDQPGGKRSQRRSQQVGAEGGGSASA